MSEDELLKFVQKTVRDWATEEAEENNLSEYDFEERIVEMMNDMGERIKQNWTGIYNV